MAGEQQIILISPAGEVITHPDGTPATGALGVSPDRLVRIDASTWAVRVTNEEDQELTGAGLRHHPSRELLDDRRIARALALLSNRERLRFDPVDGSEVTFDSHGVVASGTGSGQIFPRVDPAVIGLVTHEETGQVLLGRNARRDYYSLIAGYVDAGENLEEAFIREVWEETARRISAPRYWGSQPWPLGGSLMVGFEARTTDTEALGDTDGELADIVWAHAEELDNIPLAGRGSIAHAMLDDWRKRMTGKGLKEDL